MERGIRQLNYSIGTRPHLPKKWALRGVLIEQLFSQIFLLFFPKKNRKSRKKQETFPKFGHLTEGKKFGRLRIPMFGKKKKGKYGNTKKLHEKKKKKKKKKFGQKKT